MYTPICPVDVRVLDAEAGKRAVREMLPVPQRLLVLTTRSRSKELHLTPFFTALQGDGHALQLYADIPTNPAVEDVAALLARLQEQPFEPTTILCIGGGSCMDLGKAASALYHLVRKPDTESVREAIRTGAYRKPHICVDLIAMPTTAGTGSEVTRWATIWDPQEGMKRSIDHEHGFPKAAVIIPDWTLGMPAPLTLATGLDALSHAMEAYWAVARNPLSQTLALMAVTKIRVALPRALAAPEELNARQEMSQGCLLAGLAFSQTRTAACHSISYPLTMLRGIPHGFAVALTLSSVLRRNRKAVPELEKLDALFDEDEGFDRWLETTAAGVQPLQLTAFGVNEADLPGIVEQSFTTGRMDNNPIPFTREDVMEILLENL